MKKINLTKGLATLVDDDMFEFLNQWKWCADGKGYAVRSEKRSETGNKYRKMILMHREIMGNPKEIIDHVNGDTLDNRKSNLRLATHSQNMQNRKLQSNNSTGYKGVWYNKRTSKFTTSIKINGVSKTVGRFDNVTDAATTYDKYAKQYYGEYARLNNG